MFQRCLSVARAGSSALFRFTVCVTFLPLATACTTDPVAQPLAFDVTWGLTGSSDLPSEVEGLEITTCVSDGEGEVCDDTSCSIAALTLTRVDGPAETCRPGEGTEEFGTDPVLVRRGLPTNQPIRFRLTATGADDRPLYVASVGPFVLGEGARRFVQVRMYPVGTSENVIGASVPTALHSATYLPDGRVAFIGGFETVDAITCDEALGYPEGTRCFAMVASNRALTFDVATGTLTEVGDTMLSPRGGHTATALPDGRVLIAGGATEARMAFVPQGAGAAGGYRLDLRPIDASGENTALDNFEVFDAFLNAEEDDVDRDGDLARGGFFGVGGTRTPGALNHPRFMHAAAPIGSQPHQVLLAGGLGTSDGERSYEVFDAERAGGSGVYRGGGELSTARPMPGAISVDGTQVWIFGGGAAGTSAELADVWQATPSDPNGELDPATNIGLFPASNPTDTEPRPEYSLVRPLVATVSEGSRALVIGWYGPRCEEGQATPVFVGAGVTEYCDAPAAPSSRAFTVTGSTGLTAVTAARTRAFGAVARLEGFRLGEVPLLAFTGGVTNRLWTRESVSDIFSTDAVTAAGAADQRSEVAMVDPRIFHTSTGIPGYGMVTAGGLDFLTVGLDQVTIVDSLEVAFPNP